MLLLSVLAFSVFIFFSFFGLLSVARSLLLLLFLILITSLGCGQGSWVVKARGMMMKEGKRGRFGVKIH